jgi:hypothetical protein
VREGKDKDKNMEKYRKKRVRKDLLKLNNKTIN